jgi:hypothetical protein
VEIKAVLNVPVVPSPRAEPVFQIWVYRVKKVLVEKIEVEKSCVPVVLLTCACPSLITS